MIAVVVLICPLGGWKMSGVIIGITLAAIFAYAVVVAKRVNRKGGCPKCGTPVPAYRTPESWRQAIWGGWTCSNCGTEMDRYGAEVAS
jgi:hypothetical protein